MDSIARIVRVISAHSNATLAVASLSTIESILSNIVTYPETEKYNKLSTKSQTFRTKLADVEGATDLLAEVGFRPAVIEFEQYLVLKSVDLALLQMALEVIRERKQYCLDREIHSKAKAVLSTKEEENYKKLVKSWVEDDQKSREQIWNYK